MTYTTPTAADLKTLYPAFASVADATVDYWIARAERQVGENWPDDDRPDGVMAYAAHGMAESGIISTGGSGSTQGAISIKSGTFSASVSEAAANRTGLSATIYGRQYLDMCQRIFGGIRLVRTSDHV